MTGVCLVLLYIRGLRKVTFEQSPEESHIHNQGMNLPEKGMISRKALKKEYVLACLRNSRSWKRSW